MTPADRDRIQTRIRICEAALAGHTPARIARDHRTTITAVRRVLRTAGWPDQDQATAHIDALIHDHTETAPARISGAAAWRAYVIDAVTRWLHDGTPADAVTRWLGYAEPRTLARALRLWGRTDLADTIYRPGQGAADQLCLTRVTLTPAGIATARHDRRALHTALIGAVDDGTPTDSKARMLWCLPDRHTVLIQSPVPVGPATLAGLGAITGTSIIPRPPAGARVEVSTICNPIRRSGSKHAALPPAARRDWLTDRLRPAVDIDTVTVEALRNVRIRKPDRVATFTPVGYHAIGTVTDPDMLAALTAAGIGSGKAYGFGMLLAAEIRS